MTTAQREEDLRSQELVGVGGDGSRSGSSGALLVAEEDEIGAAADSELCKQVRNVKFHGAFGDVEAVGNFFVGQVFEQTAEDFLFAAAEIGRGVGAEAAALRTRKNRIDEARKDFARNPEAAVGDERKRTGELFAGLVVIEDAFDALTEKRVGIGFVQVVAHDDEAGIFGLIEDVPQEGSRCLPGSVGVDHVNGGFGNFHVAQVRGEHGVELLRGDLEAGVVQKAFEFGEHHGVRGKKTNPQRRFGAVSGHRGFRLTRQVVRNKKDRRGAFQT